jgi:hypothetical protein
MLPCKAVPMHRTKTILSMSSHLAFAIAVLVGSPLFGQEYVGRFDVYAGYMYLDSPHISLQEPGFHVQGGMRWSRYISLGLDYSRGTGSTTLNPNLATVSLQNQLNAFLIPLKAGGLLPQSYVPLLPLSSVTETFSGGPELVIRHFKRVTFFVRPSLGAIHEVGTGHPNDLFTQAVLNLIAPSGKVTDTVMFYGFGGGASFNPTKHFSLTVQFDLVHDHLYDDLLKDSRNTLRVSVGPTFQFGHNVPKDVKWYRPY